MTHKHLTDILTKAYLSPKIVPIYHGRWDVWLIQHGYMMEYAHLIVKNDEELNKLLHEAQRKAHQIKSSPLSKALEMLL